MQGRYDLRWTRYICARCNVPIEVASESYYEFLSADDPSFWCSACNDLPRARSVGTPADTLPVSLQLPKSFVLSIVPKAQFWDREQANLLFRPYSKRSFLVQYLAWLKAGAFQSLCSFSSTATVAPKFDMNKQQFAAEIECDFADRCNGHSCHFLTERALKPSESIDCLAIKTLCDKDEASGLCQTGDEAMLLQHYLLLTGGDHFPMLVPQPSILHGKRRPDFVCFVPITKFQYHKVAVLVDRPGKNPQVVTAENTEYEEQGFIVKRILVEPQTTHFKRARELVLWLESL